MKGKELLLTAKKKEVCSLQNQPAESQEENKMLKQSLSKLNESGRLQKEFGRFYTQLFLDTDQVEQDTDDTDLTQNAQDTNIRMRSSTMNSSTSSVCLASFL